MCRLMLRFEQDRYVKIYDSNKDRSVKYEIMIGSRTGMQIVEVNYLNNDRYVEISVNDPNGRSKLLI